METNLQFYTHYDDTGENITGSCKIVKCTGFVKIIYINIFFSLQFYKWWWDTGESDDWCFRDSPQLFKCEFCDNGNNCIEICSITSTEAEL